MPPMIRRLVKVFWRTCALLIIGVALMVQLGRELSPLVANQRGWIEQRLSAATGAQVSLGYVTADWVGLLPTLQLGNLSITASDNSDLQPLSVDSAAIQLDLSETLWRRQLIWKQLSLQGVKVSLQQSEIGSWGLPGLPVRASRSNAWFTNLDPLDMLLNSGRAELRDNIVDLQFSDGRKSNLRLPEILLENDSTDFHRISAALSIDGTDQGLNFIAEGLGDPRGLDFVGQGYLKLEQFPVDRFLQALPHTSAEPSLVLVKGAKAQLDLSIWLDWQENHNIGVVGQLGLTAENAQFETGMALPKRLESLVSGSWRSGQRWQFDISQLSSRWADTDTSIEGFSARLTRTPDNWQIYVPEIDTNAWLQATLNSHVLQGDAGDKVTDILTTLKPTGFLRQARVSIPVGDWKKLRLRAETDQLAVDSWRGAPALSGVDGYLESGLLNGFIALDSNAGFSMHYPTVYKEPLEYQKAYGTVGWNLQPDNNAVYVYSSLLNLEGEDGQASGVFKLFLPWKRGTAPSDLTLQIGLSNSLARYHKKYVPQLLPDSLLNWLDESILGGTIKQAGFLYRGRLKGEPSERAIQVFIDLDKGLLKYQPDWPAVSDINAQVVVDNGEVRTAVEAAKIYNTGIHNGVVSVVPNADGEGNILGIQAAIDGPAADGFSILRDNVLTLTNRHAAMAESDTGKSHKDSPNALQHWDLQGQLRADLDLHIPLSSGAPGHRQQVAVDLSEATLSMPDLNLVFDQVGGHLDYSDDKGLRADKLQGMVWGRPVNATITSTSNTGKRGRHSIFVNANSTAAPKQLAEWARRPELLFLDGDVAFTTLVEIPADVTDYGVKVSVTSDLKGVAVNLPDLLSKPADAAGSLRLDIPVHEGLARYELAYGEHLKGVFEERDGALVNGVLTFGAPAQLPVDPQILITGQLGQVDLQQWQNVLLEYQQFAQQLSLLSNKSASSSESTRETPALKLAVDLRLEQAQFKDLMLENLNVSGQEVGEDWHLQLQNPVLAGDVIWRADGPLSVDLDYLRLPASAVTPAEAVELPAGETSVDTPVAAEKPAVDPLADIDLASMVDIDFKTAEFKIGEEAYGQWAFALRNHIQADGVGQVDISNIQALVRGATITGLDDDGATFTWRQTAEGMASAFKGRILADGMQNVLAEWHQPRLLESEKAVFEADWQWAGSPAAISLLGLNGSLTLDVQRGTFIKGADAGANPLLRLMGLFNFDSWARRLKLDFSDLYSEGMAFDKIQGELLFDSGLVQIAQPIVAKTPSSKLQLAGVIDLENETLDTRLVATLPVGGNLTLISALAGGLPVAAGVYVASKLFENQVDKVASVSYSLSGDWSDPSVRFDKLFDENAAKKAGRNSAATAEELRKDSTPAAPVSEDQAPESDGP